MTDLFSERCGDLLTGSYDCPDRIVLNAYYSMGHAPGGFRVWWRRWHDDSDAQLDNAHLMRLAGRFARRVRASAQAHGIPVIDCKAGERKHRIAEEYLAEHPEVRVGVFLILVNRSPATVWKVDRSAAGVIHHLEKTRQFVNHYSFHIIDPTWGHVAIKISGHPPFGAQVMLNGHEYVAAAARSAGIGFTKEGNCFTSMLDCVEIGFLPDGILDQLPAPSTLGATRTGGIDINVPRIRAALAAALGLAVAPQGFTVAEFTAQVRAMTGQAPEDYSVRQGAYDLRKLRSKQLVLKPGRTRRYHIPEAAARTITALLTLREKVIAPLAAGIRTPRRGRPPRNWTTIDRDYETLRLDMQTLLNHLGIATKASARSTTFCRSRFATL
jgi:hypothetical protein